MGTCVWVCVTLCVRLLFFVCVCVCVCVCILCVWAGAGVEPMHACVYAGKCWCRILSLTTMNMVGNTFKKWQAEQPACRELGRPRQSVRERANSHQSNRWQCVNVTRKKEVSGWWPPSANLWLDLELWRSSECYTLFRYTILGCIILLLSYFISIMIKLPLLVFLNPKPLTPKILNPKPSFVLYSVILY